MDAEVAPDRLMLSTLKELVVEHIAALDSVDQVDEQSDLAALGLDSMSALNLLMDMEDEFNVEFPEEYLTAEVFQSPATLAAVVSALTTG